MVEEIDIEELEAILGLDNKSKEISLVLSNDTTNPKSFLKAVSLISNSNQFIPISQSSQSNQFQQDEIKNILKNAEYFFSSDNKDKLKLDFTKSAKNIPTDEYEIVIKEAKNNTQNKNKNNQNNQNNNQINNNKEEKNKKQKNKKKKKKEDKKVEGKEDTETNSITNNPINEKQEENISNNNSNPNNINEANDNENKNEKKKKKPKKKKNKTGEENTNEKNTNNIQKRKIVFYKVNKNNKDVIIEMFICFVNDIIIYESVFINEIKYDENNYIEELFKKPYKR